MAVRKPLKILWLPFPWQQVSKMVHNTLWTTVTRAFLLISATYWQCLILNFLLSLTWSVVDKCNLEQISSYYMVPTQCPLLPKPWAGKIRWNLLYFVTFMHGFVLLPACVFTHRRNLLEKCDIIYLCKWIQFKFMFRTLQCRVVPTDDSIVYRRESEILTIANVFVDSQNYIRLILLLIYKTIIIVIIGPIELRYFTSAPHTNEDLRPKYTSTIRAPSALPHFRHQEGLRTAAHTVRVQARFWDQASQFGSPAHMSSTLLWLSIFWMLCRRGCAWKGTECRKLNTPGPLGFSSPLEMF